MLIMILVIIKHLKNYLETFITKKTKIKYAERKQDEITGVMGALKAYAPRNNKYVEVRDNLINKIISCFKEIKGFEDKIFPVYYNEAYESQKRTQRKIEEEEREEKRKKRRAKKEEQEDTPNIMYKVLSETNNDKEKNNKLVNIFKSGLRDLENEIEVMSKRERKNKKPNNILTVVKNILKFNKHAQEGKGIKILTPKQMFNRLPIALAQLQAGNNSNKLKNEIRQLLYSLYRSKNMTEQIYKSLIGII